MRVRQDRQTESRSRGALRRRQGATREGSPADSRPADADPLFEERRMRASGGPQDRACYACACGYLFEADVSTSVACPHCGLPQAW